MLTITYEKGKYLVGARILTVEIDGSRMGELSDKQSSSFLLSDGKHIVLLRSSLCNKKVDLNLCGDDSFIVSWDRTLGGLRITDKYDRDHFFDRKGLKYLAAEIALVIPIIVLNVLRSEKVIEWPIALAGMSALLIVLVILLVICYRRANAAVCWGGN